MSEYIKGMDLSSLLEVEERGGKFSDENGPGDAMSILRRHGMNFVRLRLWNDPSAGRGEPYGANDLLRTMVLARRARALGCGWMLDIHYSDFWSGEDGQTAPRAWQDLDLSKLVKSVYAYTRGVLETLVREDLVPDMIAVGNELTNGLLWPAGRWPAMDDIARLVSAGLQAAREVCPGSERVIHLDNGPDQGQYRDWYRGFFDEGGADFDIIGMSYYPFWNGPMSGIAGSMNDAAKYFGKDVLIVETSVGYTLEDYAHYEHLTVEERKDKAAGAELSAGNGYPMTPDGQYAFLRDLSATVRAVPNGHGRGFIWWEPAWIPAPGSGGATETARAYTGKNGLGGNEGANQSLFDYDGRALPALLRLDTV